jgi:hypothetical protein
LLGAADSSVLLLATVGVVLTTGGSGVGAAGAVPVTRSRRRR